jgi:hypothetical protein
MSLLLCDITPWFAVPQHGVEDGQPLARHRDYRDKFRLASLDEALPEGSRQRIGAAATSAPMNSAARTLALPPPMQLAFHLPFWRREQRPSCRAFGNRLGLVTCHAFKRTASVLPAIVRVKHHGSPARAAPVTGVAPRSLAGQAMKRRPNGVGCEAPQVA